MYQIFLIRNMIYAIIFQITPVCREGSDISPGECADRRPAKGKCKLKGRYWWWWEILGGGGVLSIISIRVCSIENATFKVYDLPKSPRFKSSSSRKDPSFWRSSTPKGPFHSLSPHGPLSKPDCNVPHVASRMHISRNKLWLWKIKSVQILLWERPSF